MPEFNCAVPGIVVQNCISRLELNTGDDCSRGKVVRNSLMEQLEIVGTMANEIETKLDANMKAVRKMAAWIVGQPFDGRLKWEGNIDENVLSRSGVIEPETSNALANLVEGEAGCSDDKKVESKEKPKDCSLQNASSEHLPQEQSDIAVSGASRMQYSTSSEQMGETGGEMAFSEEDEGYSSSDGDDYSAEVPLSDEDSAKLVDRLMEVEGEAAEAQEALEEESLSRIKEEVKTELAETLSGALLEAAVTKEMTILIEQWESKLATLQDESGILQERLEDAGVSLPDLFKTIEKQTAECCVTEAWKKRTHWVGTPASEDYVEVHSLAEKDLETCRPVMRRRGKLVEEGASGFLEKKVNPLKDVDDVKDCQGWSMLDGLVQSNKKVEATVNLINTKEWAAVYAASTPEQAARLGLNFPGADKVEEIAEIDEHLGLEALALAEESEYGLTEQQKRNLKRVREEDDVRWMQRNSARRQRQQYKYNSRKRQEQAPYGQDEKKDGSEHQVKSYIEEAIVKNVTDKALEIEISKSKVATSEISSAKGFEGADVIILSDDDDDPPADCASTMEVILLPWKPTSESQVHCQSELQKASCTIEDGSNLAQQEETTCEYKTAKRPRERESSSKGNKRRRPVIVDSDGDQTTTECAAEKIEMLKTSEVPSEVRDQHEDIKDSLARKTEVDERIKVSVAQDKKGGVVGDMISSRLKRRPKTRRGNKFFDCTVCEKALASCDVVAHTDLQVIICKSCKRSYESSPFSKDEDGLDAECRWCGEGGDVVCCDNCQKVFCEKCIERNFGPDMLKAVMDHPNWACFSCDPSPLKELTQLLKEAEEEAHSSPSTELDDVKGSKKQFEILQSRHVKRRRNIRKVVTDDELSELTKQNLALEKERRERLEKWYEAAKESGKGRMSYAKNVHRLEEPDEEKHLCEGDCKSLGCVVNIANREVGEPLVRIPASISKLLKSHQLSGVRFMWENCIESVSKVKSGAKGLGCILAHSMGLGKTLQVIAFLYTVVRSVELSFKTVLIVVPVNVLHNWRCEFEKWHPGEVKPLQVHMLEDVSRDNAKRASHLSNWKEKGGVMLIGYAAFRNLSLGKHVKDRATRDLLCECLQNPGPDLLVCDEAHTIKNKKADITQALKQVKTQRRIALTGSPLQNNLMEYYCMVDFVREGFLGRASDFRNRFQNPIENGQHADSTAADVRKMKQRAHVLHAQLKGFVQRKDMNVLKHELPPKCVWVISVKLSALQKELYRKYLSVYQQRKHLLFEHYHSLAKIWNHPDLLWLAKEEKDAQHENDGIEDFIVESDEENESDENGSEPGSSKRKGTGKTASDNAELDYFDWCKDILDGTEREVIEHSGKMLLILRLLSLSSSQGDKMLIFSQSLHTLDLIETFLERLPGADGFWSSGREWYRLDGQTSALKRQKITEHFNDVNNTNVKCVLISTRAGSLGINLTGASRVIIVDGSWNPTHDLQALFRAWRYGQTKPVYVYRLLAYGTMEEKIYNRQLTKEGVAARVLDEHQVGRHLNADDLELLFTLDDEEGDGMEREDVPQDVQTEQSASQIQRSKHHTMFSAPSDAPPRDELMAMLLLEYRPRWIAKYHEHEPLLEDLEDEKLTSDEKLQAWEVFKRGHETEPTFQPLHSEVGSNLPIPCDNTAHFKLLVALSVPNGGKALCSKCNQNFGWEHIMRKVKTNPGVQIL